MAYFMPFLQLYGIYLIYNSSAVPALFLFRRVTVNHKAIAASNGPFFFRFFLFHLYFLFCHLLNMIDYGDSVI